jgi:hypothetical protein
MKTYTYLLSLFLLLLCVACKKETTPSPNPYTDPKLIIAYTYDYPPFVSHIFLITNYGLYEDSTSHSLSNYSFTAPALDSVKYKLVYPLLNTFPSYLLNDTGGSLSFLGSIGKGSIHVEFTQHSHTVKWNIPQDINVLPVEIQAYMQQVKTIFPQL